MGVYQRSDSPYWWVTLEGANGEGKRPQQVSTKILVASPKGKELADRFYQARMDDLARERLAAIRKIEKRNTTHGWCYVYFISDGEKVKIGRTLNVDKRLEGLQTATHRPLRVLAVFPGPPALEAKIHRFFKSEVVNQEWYDPSPRLNAFVERIKGGMHPEMAMIDTSS